MQPTNVIGLEGSVANAVAGGEEVGVGYLTGGQGYLRHALLWHGTANSAVDLNPSLLSGFVLSAGLGTDGHHEVGYGMIADGNNHALLSTGTADSAVDLQLLLPPGFIISGADSINANGNIFGTALDANFNVHAVEWVPVPEPAAWILLTAGCASFFAFRRRFCCHR